MPQAFGIHEHTPISGVGGGDRGFGESSVSVYG